MFFFRGKIQKKKEKQFSFKGPTCSSGHGRKILDERTKEIIKDEGQNIGRKDEYSGTRDLLNSCKLNLLKDSKTSGEDLTGKLTNS
jgi:hypothetical protein